VSAKSSRPIKAIACITPGIAENYKCDIRNEQQLQGNLQLLFALSFVFVFVLLSLQPISCGFACA
jgi:multidrug efflux pump subunit AcrB